MQEIIEQVLNEEEKARQSVEEARKRAAALKAGADEEVTTIVAAARARASELIHERVEKARSDATELLAKTTEEEARTSQEFYAKARDTIDALAAEVAQSIMRTEFTED